MIPQRRPRCPPPVFDLNAYMIPDRKGVNTLNDVYYISAALVPEDVVQQNSSQSGSFTLQADSERSSGMMGSPPNEKLWIGTETFDAGDLSKHGIFETYYTEFKFQFDASKYVTAFNTTPAIHRRRKTS